jgi:hypothetical protein
MTSNQPFSFAPLFSISESWLQEVAHGIGLRSLSPSSTRVALPFVELHLRKILQLAHKFQIRRKGKLLTGKLCSISCHSYAR